LIVWHRQVAAQDSARSASPPSGEKVAAPHVLPNPMPIAPVYQCDLQGKELSVDALVQNVLSRNPSLAQMVAAWQAASARCPQVTSLDDPMFGTMIAPASFGSNEVDPGYRLELSQKLPFCGKRALRGENALAEAHAAGRDVDDMRLQLIESTR